MKHLGKFALLVFTLMVHSPALSLPDHGRILVNTGCALQVIGCAVAIGSVTLHNMVIHNSGCCGPTGECTDMLEQCKDVPGFFLGGAMMLGGFGIFSIGLKLEQLGSRQLSDLEMTELLMQAATEQESNILYNILRDKKYLGG